MKYYIFKVKTWEKIYYILNNEHTSYLGMNDNKATRYKLFATTDSANMHDEKYHDLFVNETRLDYDGVLEIIRDGKEANWYYSLDDTWYKVAFYKNSSKSYLLEDRALKKIE